MNHQQDYTKPSRIKRHLKRRWKKPKLMQGCNCALVEVSAIGHFTYCADGNHQFRLTRTLLAVILAPLSQKTKVGRRNLIKPRPNRPLLNAVFLCQHILKAGLIRLSSFMACFCGQRSALAAPWCSFLPCLSTPPNTVGSISGGYPLYQGVTA